MSLVTESSDFNPLKHQPPKYNLFGRLVNFPNIEKSNNPSRTE